jgi:hypothetical protein
MSKHVKHFRMAGEEGRGAEEDDSLLVSTTIHMAFVLVVVEIVSVNYEEGWQRVATRVL